MNRRVFLKSLFVALFFAFLRTFMSGGRNTDLVLPKRTGRDTTWEGLEKALNIRRAGERDMHYYRVKAPEGYHIVPSDNQYVRHLCDAAGRQLATVYYKESFYSGQISLLAA